MESIMDTHLSVSTRGLEKCAFVYVVVATIAIGSAMTFSWIIRLGWWHTALVVVGALLFAYGIGFSFIEMRRLAQTPKERASEILFEETDPYPPRTVVVAPPTGDPYPH